MNANADTHSGPEHIVEHPLVRSYLQDLDRIMVGTEDRADVLDAVTEHITSAAASFPGRPTTAQVQDILSGLGPVERIVAAGAPAAGWEESAAPESAARPADGAWLGTSSGIVALVALVLSVVLPPLFFPLAGLALVLGIIALVRRRPRPRSAWVITVISGVLLVVVLAIGILATLALFAVGESGSTSVPGAPNPAVTSVPASVPASPPAGQP